jgi:AcrR family transcriptional regulator
VAAQPDRRATKAERREALVRAAIDVIAEKGLGGTRVADIGGRSGISPGHVLYYFDGKSDIFMRALRTIEEDLREEVQAAWEGEPSAAARWERLVELAAPTGPGDPRMLLWIQAFEQAPRDADVSEVVSDLDRRWIALLVEAIEYGRSTGEFTIADSHDFATRFAAMMDGLMLQVVAASPTLDRARMLEICARASAELYR